jgi:hypothetical protein
MERGLLRQPCATLSAHDPCRSMTGLPPSRRHSNAFFAITSLGGGRWYWVVWPSLEAMRSGHSTPHLADGYATTKAVAVERALDVARMDGEWVAAKYALRYHRALTRARRAQEQGRHNGTARVPTAQDFLYRDVEDEARGEQRSIPYRVQRRTKAYTFVEREPYDPSRLTGSWVDHGADTFRLSRAALERDGYAFVPISVDTDDPLFFTTPYHERVTLRGPASPACLGVLGLTFPCSAAQVRDAYRERVKQAHPDQGGSHEAFIALQDAYEEALRLCRGKSRRKQ